MQRSSATTAGATYLDKDRRIDELRAAARRAAVWMPSIRRVRLFGSLAQAVATPRSDADLLIVVDVSDKSDPRDRIPAVLAALSPLPCPIDAFVLTAEEFERARDRGDALVREALAKGIDLIG